jgi:hypothetical protein
MGVPMALGKTAILDVFLIVYKEEVLKGLL